MSLDLHLTEIQEVSVYSANITHNLADMAGEAGLYKVLWHPEEVGRKAGSLIPTLWAGIMNLQSNPQEMKRLNPPNGWGCYEDLLRFAEEFYKACVEHPKAKVRASR